MQRDLQCHLIKTSSELAVRCQSALSGRRHSLCVFRPVVATARLADPMPLRNPVFSELRDQQTLEPLETVKQPELVLVNPAQR